MKKYFVLLFATFMVGISRAQSTQDAYLGAKFLGYSNGKYAIELTNKQSSNCNPDFSIIPQGVTISNVTPDPKNSVTNNTINGIVDTFYLTGPFVPTAHFLITDLSICQWKGSMPTTLILQVVLSLPIDFTSFTVQKVDDSDYGLTWVTAQESNSSYFVVEASINGTKWDSIGTVKSKAVNGLSTESLSYSFLIYNDIAVKAGVGFIGIILMLSIFAGLYTRKTKLIPIVLSLGIVFIGIGCSKSSPVKTSTMNYSEFRIRHVDFDNQVEYTQVVRIN